MGKCSRAKMVNEQVAANRHIVAELAAFRGEYVRIEQGQISVLVQAALLINPAKNFALEHEAEALQTFCLEPFVLVLSVNLVSKGLNESLDPKVLLTTKQVFSAKQTSAISAALRLDQIPKEVRGLAKLQIEQGLRDISEKNAPRK